ncbi:MAG: hypothetical protein WCC17_10035 [Candidatus Nitrosopolaris sp.]
MLDSVQGHELIDVANQVAVDRDTDAEFFPMFTNSDFPSEMELLTELHSSVIPLKESELNISGDDESVIQTLNNASFAAIFTEDNIDDNSGTITLANGMTMDELNKEKTKTIKKAASARQI